VGTADVLGGAHDHRAVNVALLHAAARRRFLDGNDDDVAPGGDAAVRSAHPLDALDALGTAVIRDVQVGLHLDHCSTLSSFKTAQASASATSSASAFLPFLGGFSPFSSAGRDGCGGKAASVSAMSARCALAVPRRSTTVHAFSLETGAHSSMRTISPTWNSFAAS